jgi:hypothetical protein
MYNLCTTTTGDIRSYDPQAPISTKKMDTTTLGRHMYTFYHARAMLLLKFLQVVYFSSENKMQQFEKR